MLTVIVTGVADQHSSELVALKKLTADLILKKYSTSSYSLHIYL